jgi:hypothetical protein
MGNKGNIRPLSKNAQTPCKTYVLQGVLTKNQNFQKKIVNNWDVSNKQRYLRDKIKNTSHMRKQRTRQHFIEDFGMNHVERQILYAHCTLQRYQYDYGYDAFINTYNENGEYENGSIQIQLKSTDHLKFSEVKNAIVFDLEKRDLELWLYSDTPVIFIVYDALKESAYWLDLSIYFKVNREKLKKVTKFVRIYIPADNVFTDKTVQQFRQIKNI